MAINMDKIAERYKPMLPLYPIRNPLVAVERDKSDNAVLIYKKNFKRFEKWLHRKIGGAELIRRPLDDMGTRIWDLSDGSRSILNISRKMDRKYKERINPAVSRVVGFLKILQDRNLLFIVDDVEEFTKMIREATLKQDGEEGGEVDVEDEGDTEDVGEDETDVEDDDAPV